MTRSAPPSDPQPASASTLPEELQRQSDRVVRREHSEDGLKRAVLSFALPEGILPSSSVGQSLVSEAQALLPLHHPRIMSVLHLIEGPQLCYQVLDRGYRPIQHYLAPAARAQSLSSAALAHPAEPQAAALDLTDSQRLRLLAELAEALAYAHSEGVLHGRLGESDLFVDSRGHLALTGFGHANSFEEALPEERLDAYCPERKEGLPLSRKSDFFSWAALAYRLLARELPFEKKDEDGAEFSLKLLDFEKLYQIDTPDEQAFSEVALAIQEGLSQAPHDRDLDLKSLSRTLSKLADALSNESQAGAPRSTLSLERIPRSAELRRWRIIASALLAGGLAMTALYLKERTLENEERVGTYSEAPAQDSDEPLKLRVVADPWAHVLINGKQVATTPFYSFIELSPGEHTVVLQHPAAPREVRKIFGQAGQEMTLSVQMKVRAPVQLRDTADYVPQEDSP